MSAGFNTRVELADGVEVHLGCALDRLCLAIPISFILSMVHFLLIVFE